MNRWVKSLLIGSLFPVAVAFVGCQASTSPAPTGAPPASPSSNATSTNTDKSSKEAKIAEAMAKLSEEDRKLAMNQKVCPVSDAPLGTMDAPIKVNVKGRDVFLCCAGCEDALKAEPDKFLAKLSPDAAK